MSQRITLVDQSNGDALLADPLDVDMAALAAGGEVRMMRRDAQGELREVIVRVDDGTLAHAAQPRLAFAHAETRSMAPEKGSSSKDKSERAKDRHESPPRRPGSPKKKADGSDSTTRFAGAAAAPGDQAQGAQDDGAAAEVFTAAAARSKPQTAEQKQARHAHSFRRMRLVQVQLKARAFVPSATQRGASTALTTHGGTQRLFVVGGCGGKPSEPTSEVVEYSMGSQQWIRHELRGHRLAPRHSAVAVGIHDPTHANPALVVHGGVIRGGLQRDAIVDEWRQAGRVEQPEPGTDAHEAMLERKLFLLGPAVSQQAQQRSASASMVPGRPSSASSGLPYWRHPPSSGAAMRHGAGVTVAAGPGTVRVTRGVPPCGLTAEVALIFPATNECVLVPIDEGEDMRRERQFTPGFVDPLALAGHAGAMGSRGDMYLFGGVRADMSLAPMSEVPVLRFSRFDHGPTSTAVAAQCDVIRVTGACPKPRYGHTATYHPSSGTVVIFGGRDEHGDALEDAWAFDTAAMRWLQLPLAVRSETFGARFGHSAVLLDDNRLVFAGGMSDTTTYIAHIAQLMLVPTGRSFAATTINLQQDDPMPRFAYAAAGAAGDNASLVLFGGYGRHRLTKKPVTTENDGVASGRALTAKEEEMLKQHERSQEPMARNWTYLLAFPQRKSSSGGGDGSTDRSSSVAEEPSEKPISETFQKFIDKSMKAARVAAMNYDEAQKQRTLQAQENTDTKLWLPTAKIDSIISVFDSAVENLKTFEKLKVPTGIPGRDDRIKAVEDALAAVRQARNIVQSMKGYIPKPFRQTVILVLLKDAKGYLKRCRDHNAGWRPHGEEATAWLDGHLKFLSGAERLIGSCVSSVRDVQREVTKESMAQIETRANKLREKQHENAAKVEKLRSEAIRRDPYGPTMRELATKAKMKEDKKKKEEDLREELSKTKKGRRELERMDKKRAEQRKRLASLKPSRGPARVVRATVQKSDATTMRRLRIVARDHHEELVDALIPPPVQAEDERLAKEAATTAPPATAPATAAPPAAAGTTAAPAVTAAAAPVSSTDAPAPAPPAVGPEAAKVQELPARRAAVVEVEAAIGALDTFLEWYSSRAKATEDAAKSGGSSSSGPADAAAKNKTDEAPATASTSGDGAAAASHDEDDEKKLPPLLPGQIQNDKLEPLQAAVSAAQKMLVKVKAIRIKTNDPNRPPLEPLQPAVAAADKLFNIVRSAEQFVKLSFLSASASGSTDAAARAPSGSHFDFKPKLKAAAILERGLGSKRAASSPPATTASSAKGAAAEQTPPSAAPVDSVAERALPAAADGAQEQQREVTPVGMSQGLVQDRRCVQPVSGRQLVAHPLVSASSPVAAASTVAPLTPMETAPPGAALPVAYYAGVTHVAHHPHAPPPPPPPAVLPAPVDPALPAPLGVQPSSQPLVSPVPVSTAPLPEPLGGAPPPATDGSAAAAAAPTAAPVGVAGTASGAPPAAPAVTTATASVPSATATSTDTAQQQQPVSPATAQPATAAVAPGAPSAAASAASDSSKPAEGAPQPHAGALAQPAAAVAAASPSSAAPTATTPSTAAGAAAVAPAPTNATATEGAAAASAGMVAPVTTATATGVAVEATAPAAGQAAGVAAAPQAATATSATAVPSATAPPPAVAPTTTAVLLPASLSEPLGAGHPGQEPAAVPDAALQRLMRQPKRQETLFKGKKQLTPGQRAILQRREQNSHW